MKPHKISTHLAYSDNCYFHVFYQLSDWVEILQGFTKFNFKLNLKVSAFYLEKQKSFIPKKQFFLAVVNIKTKKLCLLTQFSRRFWCQLFSSTCTVPLNFHIVWKNLDSTKERWQNIMVMYLTYLQYRLYHQSKKNWSENGETGMYLIWHQFGCGTSKMVGPKKQDFRPRIKIRELSQITMVPFEYIDFWPKILLFRTHHL